MWGSPPTNNTEPTASSRTLPVSAHQFLLRHSDAQGPAKNLSRRSPLIIQKVPEHLTHIARLSTAPPSTHTQVLAPSQQPRQLRISFLYACFVHSQAMVQCKNHDTFVQYDIAAGCCRAEFEGYKVGTSQYLYRTPTCDSFKIVRSQLRRSCMFAFVTIPP
jgi:hypothetical protein